MLLRNSLYNSGLLRAYRWGDIHNFCLLICLLEHTLMADVCFARCTQNSALDAVKAYVVGPFCTVIQAALSRV